ncbi:MAG: vitamin B12-dependent ribonucleotide reductase [Cellulosilyticaceae bacterium]
MINLDTLLTPYFTAHLTTDSVYDLFDWKKIDIKLTDYSSGKVLVHMENLEFPTHFSQTACDIIASKYFRRSGLPTPSGAETSFKQVVHRMVNFWVHSALDEGLISPEKKEIVYNELAYMMLAQMWAPNSPQWFNTGLQLEYGISGPAQGHYYFDEKLGIAVQSSDAYTRTQGSACFIVSVEDALLGDKSLTDQLTTETRLFKYGSGVGSNWSNIRGKGENLSGGGKSSGLMSFLKVFDRNAGAIKSGGTTRRAAKMNILDINHPEALDFINWKATEEDKVRALGKMGYSTDFDGEAYDTVSGQNANNSIRVNDSFMHSLDTKDASINLINRLDGSISTTKLASDVYDQLATAAWKCGDPGIQFDDTINSWHTCPAGENGDLSDKSNRINASNPCSEYMFLDDTACNLASINILNFYDTQTRHFDLEGYIHCIKMLQIVLEATIHHGQFPTPEIATKSYHYRTTGLGLTNLGALFMVMGLPYDSAEARTVGSSLMSLLTGYSYYTSALFAKQVGPFTYFNLNKPHMMRVLRNHAICSGYSESDTICSHLNYNPIKIEHSTLIQLGLGDLSQLIKDTWKSTLQLGALYGFRNAQVSVLAPTGTIAFAMDCATTSSEPFFSHVAYKKLVGGGSLEIVNPLLPNTLRNLGYLEEEIEDIVQYILRKETKDGYSIIIDGKIEGAPHLKLEHYAIFDTANKCGTGMRYISPNGHVQMMAALTPHVSGAISKTVNLPNDASISDIKSIYKLSWELGVKAIALYRDGCKASQPLNTSLSSDDTEPTPNQLTRTKPSGIRTAHVHEAEMGGLKLYITVSFYSDGTLGELYVSAGRQGSLVKGLLDSLSTTVSKMLQYGIPAEDISRMYRGQKFEPSGFVAGHPYIKMADSISDLISKIIDIELGDYTYCQIKPDSDYLPIFTAATPAAPIFGEICPTCKSDKLIKNGTCKVCQECGSTTGCS